MTTPNSQPPVRAVVDTGVVLDAMGVRGPAAQQRARAVLEMVTPVLTPRTRMELLVKGTRPDTKAAATVDATVFIGNFLRHCELVQPTVAFEGAAGSKRQARMFTAALSAGVDIVVTDDPVLLKQGQVGALRVVTP